MLVTRWRYSAGEFCDPTSIESCKMLPPILSLPRLTITITSSPPPGPQAHLERWSLVYFTRPGNSVVLRPLVDESPIIAAAVENTDQLNTPVTANEWFTRRIKNQRMKNRTVSTVHLSVDFSTYYLIGTGDMAGESGNRRRPGVIMQIVNVSSYYFFAYIVWPNVTFAFSEDYLMKRVRRVTTRRRHLHHVLL